MKECFGDVKIGYELRVDCNDCSDYRECVDLWLKNAQSSMAEDKQKWHEWCKEQLEMTKEFDPLLSETLSEDNRRWYEYLNWNEFRLEEILLLKEESARVYALRYRLTSDKADSDEHGSLRRYQHHNSGGEHD